VVRRAFAWQWLGSFIFVGTIKSEWVSTTSSSIAVILVLARPSLSDVAALGIGPSGVFWWVVLYSVNVIFVFMGQQGVGGWAYLLTVVDSTVGRGGCVSIYVRTTK